METDKDNSKYHKLASEYSKLRAQASVLKRALLEEQNKGSCLRETLKQKEQALRRAENELDSLNFRNKQLEHRVSSLQDDLDDKKNKHSSSHHKTNKTKNDQVAGSKNNGVNEIDPIIAEELQNRIMENAKLASLIADKNNEIEMFTNRIKELENQLNKRLNEYTDNERKLRREIELLTNKNSELETKLVEATSTLGSEDGLSVTDSDCGVHINSSSSNERIAFLEKELNFYRTQYEIMKINDVLKFDEHLMQPNSQQQQQVHHQQQQRKILSSQSSTSSSMSNNQNQPATYNGPNSSNSSKISPSTKCVPDNNNEESAEINRDQLIYDYFSKRFDELFVEKCKAESKVINFENECESLKNNLELMMNELKEKDTMHMDSQKALKMLEEDFTTTRLNYEEHIKVLSEQIISLSEQLAESR